ncbi:MAG: hypothetical protein ABWZ88_19995 [Variovorax sp.]
MMKARLIALGGAATFAFAGFGYAAGVPASPVSAPEQQLSAVAGSSIVAMAVPVHVGEATAMTASRPAAALDTSSGARKGGPFHAYLLGAGRYMLDVGSFAHARPVLSTISAVPLPGALWLIGSALLVFLVISARRSS